MCSSQIWILFVYYECLEHVHTSTPVHKSCMYYLWQDMDMYVTLMTIITLDKCNKEMQRSGEVSKRLNEIYL